MILGSMRAHPSESESDHIKPGGWEWPLKSHTQPSASTVAGRLNISWFPILSFSNRENVDFCYFYLVFVKDLIWTIPGM